VGFHGRATLTGGQKVIEINQRTGLKNSFEKMLLKTIGSTSLVGRRSIPIFNIDRPISFSAIDAVQRSTMPNLLFQQAR